MKTLVWHFEQKTDAVTGVMFMVTQDRKQMTDTTEEQNDTIQSTPIAAPGEIEVEVTMMSGRGKVRISKNVLERGGWGKG